MNALPASSSPKFISPLASKLVQFLAQKHAMGYRYREEGRALPELDRFLSTRLSPEDPVITLAIVQDYVKMHNGRIDFESVVGEGTTFYVRLPVADTAAHTELWAAVTATGPPPWAQPRRISTQR